MYGIPLRIGINKSTNLDLNTEGAMNLPLMPKATAVWLIENTTLTFDQIADFCGMHKLEVQGIADGDVASSIIGLDPVTNGQLTRNEIEFCEKDPSRHLQLTEKAKVYQSLKKKKKSRYTPVARRQDKPDAIAWFLKHCPEINDAQMAKLVGTTKATINAVRNKTHWNSANIKPKDPVLLGLCTQTELDKTLNAVREKLAREESRKEAEEAYRAKMSGKGA